MEIHFIGVAGGREAMAKQYPGHGTGGFIIKGSLNIYVDPGPGALVKSRMFGEKLEDIDIVFVSHYHIDHANDVQPLAEAINMYGFKKKAILIASKSVLFGGPLGDGKISEYHKSMFKEVILAKAGETVKIGENTKMKFTKTMHDDETTVGFVLNMDGKRIGYTSDTEYFDSLCEEFRHEQLDLLIINIIKPKKDMYKHMDLETGIEVIKCIKPKKAYIYHLGGKMILGDKEKMEKFCREKSEVICQIGRDNEVMNI